MHNTAVLRHNNKSDFSWVLLCYYLAAMHAPLVLKRAAAHTAACFSSSHKVCSHICSFTPAFPACHYFASMKSLPTSQAPGSSVSCSCTDASHRQRGAGVAHARHSGTGPLCGERSEGAALPRWSASSRLAAVATTSEAAPLVNRPGRAAATDVRVSDTQ